MKWIIHLPLFLVPCGHSRYHQWCNFQLFLEGAYIVFFFFYPSGDVYDFFGNLGVSSLFQPGFIHFCVRAFYSVRKEMVLVFPTINQCTSYCQRNWYFTCFENTKISKLSRNPNLKATTEAVDKISPFNYWLNIVKKKKQFVVIHIRVYYRRKICKCYIYRWHFMKSTWLEYKM